MVRVLFAVELLARIVLLGASFVLTWRWVSPWLAPAGLILAHYVFFYVIREVNTFLGWRIEGFSEAFEEARAEIIGCEE